MSSVDDVLFFVSFLEEYFMDHSDPDANMESMDLIGESTQAEKQETATTLLPPVHVESVVIYPIKSCRGYKIPRGKSWPIAPHGLLYDREWMLVDEITGAALTQKRFPRMCMIRAEILLDQNLMIVEHDQEEEQEEHASTAVDRRLYISLEEMPTEAVKSSSRVCGDCTTVVHYTSPQINEWFSRFLGKPCRLARQPVTEPNVGTAAPTNTPSSRFVKSHLNAPEGAPIMLSNESPFLLISDKSVSRVRDWIDEHDEGQGAVRRLANSSLDLPASARHEMTSDSFRANFVTQGGDPALSFEEDHWTRIQVGEQVFDILGPCRRCHMVTIDQKTAMKNSDVFLALSKNRKAPSGQIFFGMHMLHRPELSVAPYVVRVGDRIRIKGSVPL